MTQEDKELLLKDISARVYYQIKVLYNGNAKEIQYVEPLYNEVKLVDTGNYTIDISDIKPYLRPMSSMTEEEESEYNLIQGLSHLDQHWTANDGKVYRYADAIDWLNSNHFDYRGLIEKGLALEAPEGMYN